jgi:hypothetical protein
MEFRARVYNRGMETPTEDITYEPVPQTEFERAIDALRTVLVFAEEIRREAPPFVIEC